MRVMGIDPGLTRTGYGVIETNGGIMRALRSIPVYLGIARDIEELCSDAWLLTVSNPMTALCRAVTRETSIKTVGLCHEVTITVVAEQWKDGKLREAPALKHTFRPAELLGQRVVLSHVPLDWPGDLNLASAAAPAARVEELMLGQREWVPMLQVGETTVIQSGVTTAGAIDPKPALDAMAKIGAGTAGAAKRVTSLLENLPGGDRGAAKKADDGGVWTAEWIEYEVRSPGREPVIARRQVCDLLGPAALSYGLGIQPTDG